jgi:hypothetical protein
VIAFAAAAFDIGRASRRRIVSNNRSSLAASDGGSPVPDTVELSSVNFHPFLPVSQPFTDTS